MWRKNRHQHYAVAEQVSVKYGWQRIMIELGFMLLDVAEQVSVKYGWQRFCGHIYLHGRCVAEQVSVKYGWQPNGSLSSIGNEVGCRASFSEIWMATGW